MQKKKIESQKFSDEDIMSKQQQTSASFPNIIQNDSDKTDMPDYINDKTPTTMNNKIKFGNNPKQTEENPDNINIQTDAQKEQQRSHGRAIGKTPPYGSPAIRSEYSNNLFSLSPSSIKKQRENKEPIEFTDLKDENKRRNLDTGLSKTENEVWGTYEAGSKDSNNIMIKNDEATKDTDTNNTTQTNNNYSNSEAQDTDVSKAKTFKLDTGSNDRKQDPSVEEPYKKPYDPTGELICIENSEETRLRNLKNISEVLSEQMDDFHLYNNSSNFVNKKNNHINKDLLKINKNNIINSNNNYSDNLQYSEDFGESEFQNYQDDLLNSNARQAFKKTKAHFVEITNVEELPGSKNFVPYNDSNLEKSFETIEKAAQNSGTQST